MCVKQWAALLPILPAPLCRAGFRHKQTVEDCLGKPSICEMRASKLIRNHLLLPPGQLGRESRAAAALCGGRGGSDAGEGAATQRDPALRSIARAGAGRCVLLRLLSEPTAPKSAASGREALFPLFFRRQCFVSSEDLICMQCPLCAWDPKRVFLNYKCRQEIIF